MGIEAISRGASISYFVDINSESISYIKKNLSSLGIEEKTKVFKTTDLSALNKFNEEGLKFDVIYLDPPYESGLYSEALEFIFSHDLVKENGVVACESKYPIEINPLWNIKIKEYHYGEIMVIALRK